MHRDTAETVAAQALAWLAGQPDLMGTFLGANGAAPDQLRDLAGSPVFLASVLEFLTMDDAWIMAFCDEMGLAYDMPMRAIQALPGGKQVHWT